ncbi:TRAP transporter large permease [Agrobacterium sp. 22-221-1]|uniref:TRAP transporter large permease n=1 Tax=Agrobacterium leguminum TaxID=2792015 RepID=UPI003CE56E21
MTPIVASLVLCVVICLVLATGVWIFSGLLLTGFIALYFIQGFPLDRVGSIAFRVVSSGAISWELAAVPMFIFMGDVVFRTDISQRLFNGIAPLTRLVPGGLLHTNVLGCTLFATISGSGTATTATVGRITIPELMRRGYDVTLASGSLAGAGTFGLMIPPSVAMIIYGVLAEVSIAKLFVAGVLPGIMLAALYSGYIILRVLINPKLAPEAASEDEAGSILEGIAKLMPFLILIFIVLGSIYSGLATPSEAGAVGAAGAIVVAMATRQFSVAMFVEALYSTVRMSAMISVLVFASGFVSATIAYLHIPEALTAYIASFDLGQYGLLVVLVVFYIILGTFLDGPSMTVMTVPIVLPMAVSVGLDPIWFGIFLVIMIELSSITPPVGLNINILQGLTGQTFERTLSAAMPFFALLCLGTAILAVFPQIALWLPSLM